MADSSSLSAVESVARQLTTLIEASYPAGTSLPSEAELAGRYEVSRLTVREALQFLAGRGFVDVSRGRRAKATRPDMSVLSDLVSASLDQGHRSLIDLMEVRQGIEPLTAGLAAQRISRTGLKNLKAELDGMKDCVEHLDTDPSAFARFNQHDVQFHELIADSSGNRVLSTIVEGLAPTLLKGFIQSLKGQQMRGQKRSVTYLAHKAIFDEIAAGNAEGASNAMRQHLDDTSIDISVIGSLREAE